MSNQAFFLSEHDRNMLSDLIKWWENFRPSTQGRPRVQRQQFSEAEMYVALTGGDGIPAMSLEAGTGSAFPDGRIPGSADCELYHAVEVDETSLELETLSGNTITVCNLSDTDVPADSWIFAAQDKRGTWWAIQPLTSNDISAGLTVTPSTVTGVTTLNGDSNGVITFSGTSPDATIVVAAASVGQYGIVTTGTQTFAGAKEFVGVVTCDTDLWVGYTNIAGAGFGKLILSANSTPYAWFMAYLAGTPQAEWRTVNPDGTLRNAAVLFDGGFTLSGGVYYCNAGTGGLQAGLTGPIKPGATAVGGIVTDLGSGALGADLGGTGLTSLTAHGVVVGEGTSAVNPIVLTDGKLLVGSTGADPVAAALTAGTGIMITPGAGSITIAASGLAIGAAIGSGTAGRVLFEGAGPVLADSSNFTFDGVTLTVTTTSGSTAIVGRSAGSVCIGALGSDFVAVTGNVGTYTGRLGNNPFMGTASAGWFTDGTNTVVLCDDTSAANLTGPLRLSGSTSGYVGFVAPSAAGSTTYTLPSADGSAGFPLSTDGSGTLAFARVTAAAGGTGADSSGSTGIAYDNAGVWSFFGTWDGTTLTVPGQIFTNQGKIWPNGGTGTAWEFYTTMASGIYFTSVNGPVSFFASQGSGTYTMTLSAPGGTATVLDVQYGGYHGYFEVNGSTAELQLTATAGLPVVALASSATTKGLIVRGASSQTANLLEGQSSGGTVLAAIDPSGSLALGGNSFPSGGGVPVIALAQSSGNPTGIGSNTAGLIAKDAGGGTCELYAWNESGISNQLSGQITVATAGKGISIKTGSNCKMGTGTLTVGTVTISTTAVTANSLIFLTDTQAGVVNLGVLTVSAIVAGTSFTVNSSNVLDASTFNWIIFDPA